MDERIPSDPSDDRAELFAGLYATHYRPLVAFCRRISGSSDAEELAQEAFLRAWSSWDRYAPNRPFWPWVSTIARRLCIDRGRRVRRAEARSPFVVDLQRMIPTTEELVELDQEYRWARAALEELRPDQRRVIRLRDVEGWSYDRIADHEGVTVESVRGSLRRARSRLRLVYARMSTTSLVLVVVALARDLRRRVAHWSHDLQSSAAAAGMLSARAAEGVAAIVVVALGTVPAAVTGSSPSALAAPRQSAGVVTPTTTGGGLGTSTTSTSPMRDGGSGPGSTNGILGGVVGDPTGRDRLPGPLGVVVPGGGGTTPESATFTSFTASPNYSKDHEVYASGSSNQDCLLACPELFRSTDGGATWQRLEGVGFEGGVVMLPPSYPADSRIFVGGPHALKVSSDGGRTFTALTPAGGYTAMSPAFSSGDGRILVGAIPGWIYHDDTMAVTPFDAVPESTSAALSFAYAPAYPRDHRIVIGGTDTSRTMDGIVSACDGSNCTPPAMLPGVSGTPAVMTSRSYSTSGLAFAWSAEKLFRSSDGGTSFTRLAMPAPGRVQALTEDGQGTLFLALLDTTASGTSGGLFASHDEGTTWTRLGAGTVLDHGVAGVTALPSGNILASPYTAGGGGLQCSSDGGTTWGSRCP